MNPDDKTIPFPLPDNRPEAVQYAQHLMDVLMEAAEQGRITFAQGPSLLDPTQTMTTVMAVHPEDVNKLRENGTSGSEVRTMPLFICITPEMRARMK